MEWGPLSLRHLGSTSVEAVSNDGLVDSHNSMRHGFSITNSPQQLVET